MIRHRSMQVMRARQFDAPLKDVLMRTFPVALALSLALAVSGSMGQAQVAQPADPRADELLTKGRAALDHGDLDAATDAFESALVADPGYAGTLVALGDAARKQGMPGKAIHYYRVALERDASNLSALSGEGSAMAEKGALAKAKYDLAKLEGVCGKSCPEVRALADAIAKGPTPKMASATGAKPEPATLAN